MMESKKWLWIRASLIGIGSLSGLTITMPGTVVTTDVTWISCLVVLLFSPIALLFVVGFQAINPWSAPKWRMPSWFINPFLLREPLQFFHFGAFYFIAIGFVAISTLLYRGWREAPLAFFMLSGGIGCWLGVRLCIVVFSRKMED